jgi:hypothetical protein
MNVTYVTSKGTAALKRPVIEIIFLEDAISQEKAYACELVSSHDKVGTPWHTPYRQLRH